MEIQIRNLKADEIECRVGMLSEKGISLLLYKNARVDQAILDETFGITGWQRSHCRIGEDIYCTVDIWDESKAAWVHKQDVGTEGDYEKVKGVASDSFKRACFNIGIGRELYTAPFIFIPIENVRIEDRGGKKIVKDKFAVSRISTSEEKVILSLNIVNQKGQTVFSYGKNPVLGSSRRSEKDLLIREMERTGVTEQEVMKRYSLCSLENVARETYLRILTALKKTKTAA